MQHDFEILADSTCDLSLEELASLGVEMVPLQVFVGNSSYQDMIEITSEQFYDKMAASKELPHSSQPSPTSFVAAYTKMAEAGAKQILSIHIASALSGTTNSARLAAADSPVPVRVWDSRTATMTHGMLVKEACRMRDAGETLEATLDHLEKHGKGAKLTATLLTVRNQKGCDEMVEILRKRGFDLDIVATYNAGPVIATHTGAGLIGFGCVPTDALYT